VPHIRGSFSSVPDVCGRPEDDPPVDVFVGLDDVICVLHRAAREIDVFSCAADAAVGEMNMKPTILARSAPNRTPIWLNGWRRK